MLGGVAGEGGNLLRDSGLNAKTEPIAVPDFYSGLAGCFLSTKSVRTGEGGYRYTLSIHALPHHTILNAITALRLLKTQVEILGVCEMRFSYHTQEVGLTKGPRLVEGLLARIRLKCAKALFSSANTRLEIRLSSVRMY